MTDKRVEAAARALNKLHTEDAGGCFAPAGVDTPDDCVAGICYCAKQCEREAQAVLAAADMASSQRWYKASELPPKFQGRKGWIWWDGYPGDPIFLKLPVFRCDDDRSGIWCMPIAVPSPPAVKP